VNKTLKKVLPYFIAVLFVQFLLPSHSLAAYPSDPGNMCFEAESFGNTDYNGIYEPDGTYAGITKYSNGIVTMFGIDAGTGLWGMNPTPFEAGSIYYYNGDADPSTTWYVDALGTSPAGGVDLVTGSGGGIGIRKYFNSISSDGVAAIIDLAPVRAIYPAGATFSLCKSDEGGQPNCDRGGGTGNSFASYSPSFLLTENLSGTGDGTYYVYVSPYDGSPPYDDPSYAYYIYTVSGGVFSTEEATSSPVSGYNQIVRYIPSLNYSTTTGSTLVGVEFSIANPDWIEGVGFELSGTPNVSTTTTSSYLNTLYEASTTVSIAQTFSLTTNYNFTSGGYYSIVGYFIQNGKKIYNSSAATILIDYTAPNIVIGSDGVFHFNATTTVATSSLDALHIDCGDTIIVSSLCKIAVSFVIPDPSSIQGVKSSWNALLTKAPFSFFTESKNVLGAFASTTASSGGTLALNFYGQNAPLISTSTANSIGLGSSTIEALKFLITVGLWILMAWFIYWRIGGLLAKIERV